MSERGKELDAQAKKLHDQAAHAIYLHRNGGRPDNYIDLHGLFVEEALRFLKERLKTFAPGEKLEVVTGAGHHSEDHQAKIKPAVISGEEEPALEGRTCAGRGFLNSTRGTCSCTRRARGCF